MQTEKKYYIDTSVFIWKLHSDPGSLGYKKATRFFTDLANGIFKGVTSSFTKFEYRGYLKEQWAQVGGKNATSSELDAQSAKLTEMIDDFGIEEVLADYVLNQDWIPKCEKLVNDSQPTLAKSGWNVLKGADAIHAAVANRIDAQKIATLDKGFTGLSDSTVSAYVLWDVY